MMRAVRFLDNYNYKKEHAMDARFESIYLSLKQHPRFVATQLEQTTATQLSTTPGDFKFWLDPTQPTKLHITYRIKPFITTTQETYKTFTCDLDHLKQHLHNDLTALAQLIEQGLIYYIGIDHDLTLTNIHTAKDEAQLPRKQDWSIDFDKILLYPAHAKTVIKMLNQKANCRINITSGHRDKTVIEGTLTALFHPDNHAKFIQDIWQDSKDRCFQAAYQTLLQTQKNLSLPVKKPNANKKETYEFESAEYQYDQNLTLPKPVLQPMANGFPQFSLANALENQKNQQLVIDIAVMLLVNDVADENTIITGMGGETFAATQDSPEFWLKLATFCGLNQNIVEQEIVKMTTPAQPTPFQFYQQLGAASAPASPEYYLESKPTAPGQ